VAEHRPQGPTEEHLVEEIAGILWRKRRLRLAEAAAHRRGLEGTMAPYRRERAPGGPGQDDRGTMSGAAERDPSSFPTTPAGYLA